MKALNKYDVRWVARNMYTAYCNTHDEKYSPAGKCPKCENVRVSLSIKSAKPIKAFMRRKYYSQK
jgi:hypothetical protein